MPRPHILISIETYAHTATEAFGRRFIEALCAEDDRLVPELVSTSERFKDPFVDIDHFVNQWWALGAKMRMGGRLVGEYFVGPMWKRKSALASRGHVKHGQINQRNEEIPGYIWYECRWDKNVDFDHLFGLWVRLAQANIGMLHLFSDPELGQADSEAKASFAVGSFGGPFKPGLPNIGWAMAFGNEYQPEVDVARIKQAGFPIEEVGRVLIVRVTERLSDVVDNFAHFSRRRAELRSLFRRELFWIQEEPSTST